MSSYKPPYTITSKILILTSKISELILDIKYIDKNYSTLTLRKKNRIKSITGTLQIEGNTFDEERVTNVINGKTVFGTILEIISKSLKDYIKTSKKDVPKNVPIKRVNEIVNLIKKDKNITILQIAGRLGVSDKTIKRDISKLKNEKRIVRVGGLKGGHWEVTDEI